jgi:hypothetical protein
MEYEVCWGVSFIRGSHSLPFAYMKTALKDAVEIRVMWLVIGIFDSVDTEPKQTAEADTPAT